MDRPCSLNRLASFQMLITNNMCITAVTTTNRRAAAGANPPKKSKVDVHVFVLVQFKCPHNLPKNPNRIAPPAKPLHSGGRSSCEAPISVPRPIRLTPRQRPSTNARPVNEIQQCFEIGERREIRYWKGRATLQGRRISSDSFSW